MRVATLITALCWPCLTLAAEPPTLTLLNWEAYLAPAVIEQWEAESGARLEQVYFDNDERRDQLLVDVARHRIDLVVVDEVASRLFGERGVLYAPAVEAAPNLRHIEPDLQAQCGEHSVPYMWGTLGIVYRTDRVAQPDSWADLMQPEPALYGHIGMMDDVTDMLAPALLMRGQSVNTADEEPLKVAFDDLRQQLPAVLTFEYAITYLQSAPRADDLYMAAAYSGDQAALNEIAGEARWDYVVPQEGTILWADCLAVVSGSPQAALAEAFIDFLNRPEVAALNAQDLRVASGNAAGNARLPAEMRKDPRIFPPAAVMARRQLYEPLSKENLLLRQRITHAIRKRHDAR
jgi:spermidine/putrescine transport system substrate-binding protein